MQPTITYVNPQEGTVTVKMAEGDGWEGEKTFQLTEDVEYLDSTGQLITLDVFRSGDEVLIIEMEGKIRKMKKHSKMKNPGAKEKTQSAKKSETKRPSEQKARH